MQQKATCSKTEQVQAKKKTEILPFHVTTALNYLRLKVKESPMGSNKGKYIDNWNKPFNLGAIPWCAASMSNWARVGKVKSPVVFSCAAKNFYTGKTHTINDVYYKRYIPKPGDYRVKRRKGGNHVDVIIAWNAKTSEGLILGGNVSDAVTLRKITVKSMIADGTSGITEVSGIYEYEYSGSALQKFVKNYENVKFK